MPYPAHFAEKLESRFHMPYTDTIRQKILSAIGSGKAHYKCSVKDEKGVKLLFYTRIFGSPMIVVISKDGTLITCYNPSVYSEERGKI
jgi:hypothetical protein